MAHSVVYILIIILVDLMWSDPEDIDGIQLSPRGAGYLFGSTPVHNVFYFLIISLVLQSQWSGTYLQIASTRSRRH